MTYYLRRRQSSIKRTQGIVSWLVLYFVSTGAVLVAIALTILISFLIAPNSMLYAGFILIYARALANALFGALNARQRLRTRQNEIVTFGGVSLGVTNTPTSHQGQNERAQEESTDTIIISDNTKDFHSKYKETLTSTNEV
ncbi:hypothetical protein QCA50_016597 [Cerrena zonata]|uniref:DUF6534 domain-containing protein n=1 Tax=Cerrena zonata TaxID=2478898 RepID=A0AAW0FM16_9APHY